MSAAPRFTRTAGPGLIVARLVNEPVGSFISYAELSRVVSETITGASPAWQGARRRLLNDHGQVWGCVTAAGVKRLSDAETLHTVEHDTARIRGLARRGVRKLETVDVLALEPGQQRQHLATATTLAFVDRAASPKAVQRLAQLVTPGAAPLPVGDTLKAFQEVLK